MPVHQPHVAEMAQGVYAFLCPHPRFGHSNVGLVIDDDGLTVIDTSATPEQAGVIAAAIKELTGELGRPLRQVVLTSSRAAFCGGSPRFWSAGFYGSETTSAQLDAPVNTAALRMLLPEFADSYNDEFETRPITHVLSEAVQITPAATAVPLVGESAGNVAVFVESANVVFAGALASFRVTPLAYDGYPSAWIDSLRVLAESGATVVPGHGPIGGTADLNDQIDYLQACHDAEIGTLRAGPWQHWSDRRFDAVNVERSKTLMDGHDRIPRAMLRLLGVDRQ